MDFRDFKFAKRRDKHDYLVEDGNDLILKGYDRYGELITTMFITDKLEDSKVWGPKHASFVAEALEDSLDYYDLKNASIKLYTNTFLVGEWKMEVEGIEVFPFYDGSMINVILYFDSYEYFDYKNKYMEKRHPTKIENYSLEKIHEQIGDLRYDLLLNFFTNFQKKIANDAQKDKDKGRVKLGNKLDEIAHHLGKSVDRMEEIVKICKPYIEEEKKSY